MNQLAQITESPNRLPHRAAALSASVVLPLICPAVILLGTWVVNFGWPVWIADLGLAASFVVDEKTFWQMNLITALVAIGSLTLAFWTIKALRCRRPLGGHVSQTYFAPSRGLSFPPHVSPPFTSS